MKKTKIFAFVLLIVASLSVFTLNIKRNMVSFATHSSSGVAMCVIEKDSKRILYSKNEHKKLPMASTTKVMTAITVIQNCTDLEQYIQVDDSSIGVEGTSIYLRQGEMIKVKDLLYGLMLRSGNDAATALACHVGGDVKGFANMMNNLAKTIGATNSNFVNPHGLDHKDHYTTAYDLALISAYALNNPIFKDIVSTKTHVIDATNKSDKRYLTNKNRLLSSLDGCCGVKTGFTSKAGRCLVSASERDNMTIVCTVLNCGPMFEESTSLINSAFAEFEQTKVIDKNKEIYNEYIIDENQGKLYLYAEEDFYYPLGFGEINDLRLEYNVALDTAKEGQTIGEVKIFFKNDLISTIKLVTINKIDKLIDNKTLQISELLWEEKINEN
ncbi:MAG: D-alanyl-D-alanine carboxypeptidase [Clostridia bacterium]|nr:D-alanyl-D-alanine carboxypeptidase [Clostridia bacterium]